jgi:hypothetical protein
VARKALTRSGRVYELGELPGLTRTRTRRGEPGRTVTGSSRSEMPRRNLRRCLREVPFAIELCSLRHVLFTQQRTGRGGVCLEV